MYTSMGNSKSLNRKVRRIGQIWKRIAIVMIVVAGIYTTVILGNVIVENLRLARQMENRGNYNNIDISMEVKQGEIPLFLQFDKRRSSDHL